MKKQPMAKRQSRQAVGNRIVNRMFDGVAARNKALSIAPRKPMATRNKK